MYEKEERPAQEKELRNLIRSLSRVSEKETREIREIIAKQRQLKNGNRIKYNVQQDQLLKDKKVLFLPNLLLTYKLFQSKNKKIQSIKERYIESQAYLKRAHFQSKKIDKKRQQIAKKHHNSELKYQSAPLIQKEKIMMISQPKLEIANAFDNQEDVTQADADVGLLDRIKTTVHQSRKEIKNLYDSHVRQLHLLPFQRRRSEKQQEEVLNQSQISSCSQLKTPIIQPTKSVIFPKPKGKKKLDQLIRLSAMRSQEEKEGNTSITMKEREDRLRTDGIVKELQVQMQQRNKLKESIVLGQLKKLLYGDRRGRFIQDCTFKTRLKGEYSKQYMRIVSEQQEILQTFEGSYLNRRNLVEKFSNILGSLHSPTQRHKASPEITEFDLQS